MAVIQIEESELRAKALQMFQEEAERFERETGKQAKDLRKDPTWKAWMDRLGSTAAPEPASAAGKDNDFLAKTPGQVFAESAALKAYLDPASTERASKRVKVPSFDPRFRGGRARSQNPYLAEHMKSVLGGHYKEAGIGGAAGARGILAIELLQEIIELPHRPEAVRDLFTSYPTSAGAIHYVRQTGYVNRTAAVPENIDPAVAVARPQSTVTFTPESTTIRTVSHWIPVPNQMFDDIVALAPYLDNQLILMMRDIESVDLFYGDGLGNNLQGLLTDNAIQTLAWSAGYYDAITADHIKTDNQADAILRAKTKLQVAWYEPDGYVLSKNSLLDIQLLKGSHGQYLFPNGLESLNKFVGMDGVATTAIHDSDVAVGAYKKAAAIWDREEATIRVSDSHANFFTEGMKCVLAEERLALTAFRPESFCLLDLDTAPHA